MTIIVMTFYCIGQLVTAPFIRKVVKINILLKT